MVLFYSRVLGTILVNIDGITFGFDVGTELGSVDGSFDGFNDDKLEGLFLGDSLVSTDGKVIDTILGNVYGIILVIDIGTDLGYLDGYFGNIY